MSEINFLLQRFSASHESTLGLLVELEGLPRFHGYTLEDEHRDVKVAKETRIPFGKYELKLKQVLTPLTVEYRKRYPGWFIWHIELVGVPGSSNVYVHIGNTDKDTDACILLGDGANNNQQENGFVSKSTQCFQRWYVRLCKHLLAGGRSSIEIRDETALNRR